MQIISWPSVFLPYKLRTYNFSLIKRIRYLCPDQVNKDRMSSQHSSTGLIGFRYNPLWTKKKYIFPSFKFVVILETRVWKTGKNTEKLSHTIYEKVYDVISVPPVPIASPNGSVISTALTNTLQNTANTSDESYSSAPTQSCSTRRKVWNAATLCWSRATSSACVTRWDRERGEQGGGSGSAWWGAARWRASTRMSRRTRAGSSRGRTLTRTAHSARWVDQPARWQPVSQ